jgi:hypothetical protein
MTRNEALQMFIRDRIETGRYYVESNQLIGNQWYVLVHFSRGYNQIYMFDDELAYEVFTAKLSKGYTNYFEMAHDCQFDLEEKIKDYQSFYSKGVTQC